MAKEIFSIQGSRQEKVENGLRKAGFRQVASNREIDEPVFADIFTTFSRALQEKLAYGEARFMPGRNAVFSDGTDSVGVYEFDIEESQVVDKDPVVIVNEVYPGRTSQRVQEILEDIVKVDIATATLVTLDSNPFKISVKDLAGLRNESAQTTYDKCVKSLIRSCVAGIKRIDVDERVLTTKTPVKEAVRLA